MPLRDGNANLLSVPIDYDRGQKVQTGDTEVLAFRSAVADFVLPPDPQCALQCMGYVREGDQLIVTRIDRLARSTLHLCQIAETLREKNVDLVVLDQNIDTTDATGRLLFNMLGAIGQFETEIRAERQMDGIKKAKDRGVQFGKRPALTADQIEELRKKRQQGALIKNLMAHYDLSKATIYRYLGTKNA